MLKHAYANLYMIVVHVCDDHMLMYERMSMSLKCTVSQANFHGDSIYGERDESDVEGKEKGEDIGIYGERSVENRNWVIIKYLERSLKAPQSPSELA